MHVLVRLSFILSVWKISSVFSCIQNTTCQCLLTKYSLTLTNCSYTLTDLPNLDVQITTRITRLIARKTFNQWPKQLCNYPNLQILDLSGAYFDSQSVNLNCLDKLIYLNLSNTQLKENLYFQKNISQHLQILDLSNNHIKNLDFIDFQSLTSLISLFLQNNPIQTIDHLEYLFLLPNLQSCNLISANLDIFLQQIISIQQWIDIANQWSNSTKSFLLRMNNIPFQSIIPNPEQFERLQMDIILQTLINSTFITLFNTPKCHCQQLREYQRIFFLVKYQEKYSSSLYQSVKCLMNDGITHAKLFDRRTLVDLRCPTQ